MPLDLHDTVAEIVAAHPECARVFQAHRIDFCCQGAVPLGETCRARGLRPEDVLAELEAALRRGGAEAPGLRALSTPALIEHLVSTHHAYLRQTLPWVAQMAAKVARVHGARDPRLEELDATVRDLGWLLLRHLDDEEQATFPALLTRSGAEVQPLLEAMRAEHLAVGGILEKIRGLTDDLTPPVWACATYRTLLAELEHLEGDTLRHVHTENHVLAARAQGSPA